MNKEKLARDEIMQVIDEHIAEANKLAELYRGDGLDSHPEEFKQLREKRQQKITEICLKYGIPVSSKRTSDDN